MLSHPFVKLSDHLQQVYTLGTGIFERNGLFKSYSNCLHATLLLHDIGKGSVFFQRYISGVNSVNSRLRRHSEISALWTYYYLLKTLKTQNYLPILGYLIVLKHHGNLDNYLQMFDYGLSDEELSKINEHIDYSVFEWIEKYLPGARNLINRENFNDLLALRRPLKRTARRFRDTTFTEQTSLVFMYLYSILLTSDKQAAIFNSPDLKQESSKWNLDFVLNYRKSLSSENAAVDDIRKTSFNQVINSSQVVDLTKRFFSIQLPTGSGKTLTSLGAALKLKERMKEKRKIIYCLPYTSIIDQNAEVLEDILSANGLSKQTEYLLKHHHLSSLHYENEEETISNLDQSLWLVESWNSEMIITTFHQFLSSFLSNNNRDLKRLHCLANSIVILDEVQAIPLKYYVLINRILVTLAESMNVHFILTTATMPLIFDHNYNEIYELASDNKRIFSELARIHVIREPITSIDAFLVRIADEIEDDPSKSRLLIFNTISSASLAFNYLKEITSDIVYLTTEVIPKHRLERIKSIKENSSGKTVITTQLIEAGVDIDMDIVYRDFAPLDSLFQACGRCNRNNKQGFASEVRIVELTNHKKKRYWEFIYDEVLIDTTRRILPENELVPESRFFDLSCQYYYGLRDKKSTYCSEVLLERIAKIQFRWAFQNDDDDFANEGNNVFRLIDDRAKSNLFVQLDDISAKVINEYFSLMNDKASTGFEKKSQMKLIYRIMSPYIISVPKSNLFKDDLNIIDESQVTALYDYDTGFKRIQQQSDYVL